MSDTSRELLAAAHARGENRPEDAKRGNYIFNTPAFSEALEAVSNVSIEKDSPAKRALPDPFNAIFPSIQH